MVIWFISKLSRLKLLTYLYNSFLLFITNHIFQVRINFYFSQVKQIKTGVLQRSVLGSTLFNIYCCDIPTPQNCQLIMFDNDTVIITQNKIRESSINDLKHSLDKLSRRFLRWKLNPIKSETKICTLKTYANTTLIQINNQEIKWSSRGNSIKYLGVNQGEKLGWIIHINKKLNQGYTIMTILYPLLNHNSTLQITCSLLLTTVHSSDKTATHVQYG